MKSHSRPAIPASRVTKRIELCRHKLVRDLDKIENIEKSQIRMIEVDRKLFRMKHGKLRYPRISEIFEATDDGNNSEADDDSRTSAKKDGALSSSKIDENDSGFYDAICSLIFTGGQVDIDKIMCLHLLTAHAVDENDEFLSSRIVSSKKDQSRPIDAPSENHLCHSWNDILPCYIVEIQRDESKFHNEQVRREQEDDTMREFELRCREYVEGNEDFSRALQSRIVAPCALGKIPIVSQNLYDSLLGEAAQAAPPAERCFQENFKSFNNIVKQRVGGDLLNQIRKESDKNSLLKTIDSKSAIKQQSIASINYSNLPTCADRKKVKNYIFLQPSIILTSAQKEKCKEIFVCINSNLRNLVQAVTEVLYSVSPEKAKILFETLVDLNKMRKKLREPKMQSFFQSLKNTSIVSSPENYQFLSSIGIEKIYAYPKNKFTKHVIAETLDMAPLAGFDNCFEEIRKNIFMSEKKKEKQNMMSESLEEIEVLSTVFHNNSNKNKLQEKENFMSPKATRSIQLNSAEAADSISFQAGLLKTNASINSISNKNKNKFSKLKKNSFRSNTSKSRADTISQYRPSLTLSKLESRRVSHANCFTDPDRVILRRMTNPQRILVGQMCAALKTRKVNNEGLLTEKVPLPALIAPVLSRETIRRLTRGTCYAKENNNLNEPEELEIKDLVVNEKLTGLMISKIRHEVADAETKLKLNNFMKKTII